MSTSATTTVIQTATSSAPTGTPTSSSFASTATPSPVAAKAKSSNSAAIGAGVGVPLGLLLLASLGLLLWRESKRRNHGGVSHPVGNEGWVQMPANAMKPGMDNRQLRGDEWVQEMEHPPKRMGELQSAVVHEVPGHF